MEKLNADKIRLRDMLNAIADIEAFGKPDFEDRKTLFATAYGVAVIGEVAHQISAALQAAHPEIPWVQIIGMRHRIIHGYGTINKDRLREVVVSHLPVLEAQLETILAAMD